MRDVICEMVGKIRELGPLQLDLVSRAQTKAEELIHA